MEILRVSYFYCWRFVGKELKLGKYEKNFEPKECFGSTDSILFYIVLPSVQ
jgi:hypothetical protein